MPSPIVTPSVVFLSAVFQSETNANYVQETSKYISTQKQDSEAVLHTHFSNHSCYTFLPQVRYLDTISQLRDDPKCAIACTNLYTNG